MKERTKMKLLNSSHNLLPFALPTDCGLILLVNDRKLEGSKGKKEGLQSILISDKIPITTSTLYSISYFVIVLIAFFD